MRIYGHVIIKNKDGSVSEYSDDNIKTLVGKKVGSYGSNWRYGGDQGFSESNICVSIGSNSESFGGRNGLKDALKYIHFMSVSI